MLQSIQNAKLTVDPLVKIGPQEERAGRHYFLVKHGGTERLFKIGEKERFMLACMNGANDIAEIERLYEDKYLSRMTPASWQQLLKMLGERSLLAGRNIGAEPVPIPRRKRFMSSREGLFEWKIRLVNPQAILAAAEPRLRVLFSPAFLLSAFCGIVFSQAWALRHLGGIYSQLGHAGSGHWGRIACFAIPIFLISAAIHEAAHAITCQHFGGTVTDMGVIFRYLNFYPYTQLDDVMLFHNRLHRIYVLAAGMFATLLFGVPFVALWAISATPLVKAVSGILIFALSFGTLLNLIPFIQLDGYWILTSALRMPELRQDSYVLLRSLLQRLVRASTTTLPYSRREIVTCLVYGTLSILASLYVAVSTSIRWHRMLTTVAGNIYSWILIVTLMSGFALLKAKRRTADGKQPHLAASASRRIAS